MNMYKTYENGLIKYTVQKTENTDIILFENHVHSEYELLFVFEGEGSFVIEDGEYPVSRNALFLVPPGKYHKMNLSDGVVYKRCFIHFDSSVIPTFLDKKINLHQIVDDKIRSLMRKMEEYVERYPSEAVNVLLPALIQEVIITSVCDDEENTTQRGDVPALVKRAIEYVADNIYSNMTVDSIAKELFVSKTHLSHLFSKTLGVGVMHYVATKKVYKARSLIRKGKSVKDVCDALGYVNYTTFLRNYRNHFGVNPSEEKREKE